MVVTWLNRGYYTFSNRTNAHPIGTDLDITVYDPLGNFVGSPYSWDNGYEIVEFDPTMNGHYTIEIRRYANRDTQSNLRIGLAVMSSKSSWRTE